MNFEFNYRVFVLNIYYFERNIYFKEFFCDVWIGDFIVGKKNNLFIYSESVYGIVREWLVKMKG